MVNFIMGYIFTSDLLFTFSNPRWEIQIAIISISGIEAIFSTIIYYYGSKEYKILFLHTCIIWFPWITYLFTLKGILNSMEEFSNNVLYNDSLHGNILKMLILGVFIVGIISSICNHLLSKIKLESITVLIKNAAKSILMCGISIIYIIFCIFMLVPKY